MHVGLWTGGQQRLKRLKRTGIRFKGVQTGERVARMSKITGDKAHICAHVPKYISRTQKTLKTSNQRRIMVNVPQDAVQNKKRRLITEIEHRHAHLRDR